MTSALRGREGVGQNVTIVRIGCVRGTVTRRGGSTSPKFIADVILVSPQCLFPIFIPLSYPHFVPWFLLLEEISFGVDDGVEHAEGLLRADGHAAVAAVQLILAVVLSKEDL